MGTSGRLEPTQQTGNELDEVLYEPEKPDELAVSMIGSSSSSEERDNRVLIKFFL